MQLLRRKEHANLATELLTPTADVIFARSLGSEVLQEALGKERGTGARVCFGVGSLGCVVSCDLEVRLRPQQ